MAADQFDSLAAMSHFSLGARGTPAVLPLLGMFMSPFAPYRGVGYIAGTVTVSGNPAVRNVYLCHRATGVLVAKTRSAEDGSYRFDRINTEEEFFALATDATEDAYNAAVADMLTPAT